MTEPVVYTEAVKDSAGTVISVNYTDVLGRTVKEISGTTYTDYTYDAGGNSVVSYEGNTVNEEALVSMTLYDSEGRSFAELTAPQISGSDYTIGEETVVTYTEYDAKGNTSKETDALGTAVHYTYDEEGKLASTDIAGDGEDITVTYSVQEDGGELIQVTDANGNVKEEYLNAAGLTVQTADFDGDSEENTGIVTSYEYDKLGRKTVEKYSDDTFISYSYDGDSDRVLEKAEYLADEEKLESITTYTYDSKNQVTGIQHKEGTETVAAYAYTYDVSGRVLTESVSYDSETEKVTAYEYDAEGRLVKVIYPESSGIGTITYTYDSFGNVLEIKKDNALVREYVYDAFYRVVRIKDYDTPGSGSYTLKTYTYDNFGRTVSAVYTEDGDSTKVLESFAYSYDKNDNILSETRISNLPAEDKVINETRDYVYDAYGRLTQSTITDHTAEDAQMVTTYEYDAVGNRTKQTKAGVETTYTYNGLNQLTHMETPTEEVTYEYDSRGNQIEEKNTTTEETTETAYNVAGEMVQLVKKNGETTVFTQNNVYNQDGSCISRTQGDVEREYYYHSGVVAFTEDNNVLSASNLQNETGSVFGTYRGEDYYNYLKNLQGSTMSITGENGQAVAVYSYSDFGETEEVVADSIVNEICYTGAVYDKDTGLYYMNARYYDAVTGRFISQDSYRGEIEDTGTWHLYAYCSNNPVNCVDSSGHKWTTFNTIKKLAKNKNNKKAVTVMARYEGNRKRAKDKNRGNTTGMITKQHLYSHIYFRATNVKHAGCGIIAVHNLMKLKNKSKNFLKLVAEFDYKMLMSGVLGITHETVKAALDKYVPCNRKWSVDSFDDQLKTYGIMLYLHSEGGHYVAAKRTYNGKIALYNYNKEKSTRFVSTDLSYFMNKYNYEYVVGFLVK